MVAVYPKGVHFDDANPITDKHVQQLCDAVDTLHARGLAHGDICESNIYVVPGTGDALLTDWSHACETQDGKRHSEDYVQLIRAVLNLNFEGPMDSLLMERLPKVHRSENRE